MHHKLTIGITEPTMSRGIWTLAQFYYRDVFYVARTDMEDYGKSKIAELMERESRAQVRGFRSWSSTMPAVDEYWQRPELTDESDRMLDAKLMVFRTKGWFKLSDDEVETECLLKQVNADALDFPQRYFHYDPPALPASEVNDSFAQGLRYLNETNPMWSVRDGHLDPARINDSCLIPDIHGTVIANVGPTMVFDEVLRERMREFQAASTERRREIIRERIAAERESDVERLVALYGSPVRAMINRVANNEEGDDDGRRARNAAARAAAAAERRERRALSAGDDTGPASRGRPRRR